MWRRSHEGPDGNRRFEVRGRDARAFVAQFRAGNTEVLVLHVLQPLGLMAPPEMAMGYAPDWKR